jgi:hypothetical protein
LELRNIQYEKPSIVGSTGRELIIIRNRNPVTIRTQEFNCPHCDNRNITYEVHRLWIILSRKERKMFEELNVNYPTWEIPDYIQERSDFLDAYDPFVDCKLIDELYTRVLMKQNRVKALKEHIVILV